MDNRFGIFFKISGIVSDLRTLNEEIQRQYPPTFYGKGIYQIEAEAAYNVLADAYNTLLRELKEELTDVEVEWVNSEEKTLRIVKVDTKEELFVCTPDFSDEDREDQSGYGMNPVLDFCNENKLAVKNRMWFDTFDREGLWYHSLNG